MPKKAEELNIPKEFSGATLNETAKDLLAKSNAYRQLFGDDFVSQGFQQLGPQFFTLLDAELSRNPNILANISATSGMYNPDVFAPQTAMPGMVNARLGTELNNFRAGVSVPFVQGPDTTYRRMPMTYDVGYNTGLFGGNLDLSAGVTPKEGFMPKTDYNIMARYNKTF